MKKLFTSLLLTAYGLTLIPNVGQAVEASAFNDVYEKHYNREAIETLKSENVIKGYDDGNYKPENRINRAEFTKILIEAKFSDSEINNCIANHAEKNWTYAYFTDVPITEWFAPYVCMAKVHQIIDGYPDGTFKPGAKINFAEASKIIAETMDIDEDKTGTNGEWFAGYIKGLEDKKAIPTTIENAGKDVSRGEMAEMIWRLKENKKDKVTATYQEITSEFPQIQSCEALKEKFEEYQSYQYYPMYRGIMVDDMVMEEAETAAPMMKASDAAGLGAGGEANEYSSTNIQVEGVDEADIIKNDGKYIYLIKGNTVRIVNAYPPNQMEATFKLDFEEEAFYPQEIYAADDKLTIIGRTQYLRPMPLLKEENQKEMMMPPYYYGGDRTRVYVYDISDRANPEEERVTTFDGYYQTSRRIGDQLYLVLNAHPNVWRWSDIETGDDIIPEFKDGDNDEEKMVSCSDIRYFPGHAMPRYLITTSIPLDDPDGKIDREVFLGSSENVYASTNNLYVATSATNYDRFTDWDWSVDNTKTNIFKFELDDGNIEYKGRGEVPGRILNQFSMDENGDYFRIATTKGNSWNDQNPSTNNLYVLGKDMDQVGSLEGLAPGEKIYSTRFMGNRLYMVTFKQVDPLFVIDLKSPSNPKLLGKLKIPGFSNYLHPYDENHIIGFGKDTEVTEKDQVLMQGMKMAIFDVSDVENPKQMFTENIGDRGTDSELLNNHKALLFDKSKNLLAFPINIREKVEPEDLNCNAYRYDTCPNLCRKRCIPTLCTEENGVSVCTEDCGGLGSCIDPSYERYETTFVGALVYNIDLKKGFTQRGRITHYDEADTQKMGDYWPYQYEKNIQRIIYIGNYLYTISQSLIKANEMNSINEVGELELK